MRAARLIVTVGLLWACTLGWTVQTSNPGVSVIYAAGPGDNLDRDLAAVLSAAGFRGNLEETLQRRLRPSLNPPLVELGHLLFFDNILGLHEDNSCAGCHSPGFGFGDSQSMAIGTQSNKVVGRDRAGPRNQRKAPMVINSAFIPKLMLNGRFEALSGDPFDNSLGFQFPPPEGLTRFPPGDRRFPTLLSAQGHIPETELVEMAGFNGARNNPFFNRRFWQFDDGKGTKLPGDTDGDGFLNEEIRTVVLSKIRNTAGYLEPFRRAFGMKKVKNKNDITFAMVGQALSEYQTSLMFANAPIDRFARGRWDAMTNGQKRGALLFFGKAGCTRCHDASNQMFSDYDNHVLGVPQVAPVFGKGTGNVIFDGPDENEDFGRAQITGEIADRYKFRTSPIRNVALQPAFFHDGAFTRLEDAVRHHLDARASALAYDPEEAGVDEDLTHRLAPIRPILKRLDPLMKNKIELSSVEFRDLMAFVRDGLLDPQATKEGLCSDVPTSVPSGIPVVKFQNCE